MSNQTRLQKLQSDFKKHEQKSEKEELAVAIHDERHEERIKKAKKVDVEHPSNKFF